MSAEDALTLNKGRDSSEKLFCGDKSCIGDMAERGYGSESVDTKVLIEFVALIIRNQIYNRLKEEMLRNDKKLNFMTVPAALRELEKIEKAQTAVFQTKGKYDAAVEELNNLQKKKRELQKQEILKAIEESTKSYDEIMAFFAGNPDPNEE